MKECHMIESNQELSTTALAKELNKSTQELFQQLSDMGLILRNGDNWELTAAGKLKGGLYREYDKYKRYIVWPISFKDELDDSHPDFAQNLLTSTVIGKHFNLSPTKINLILSELGLIDKNIKGYSITSLGKMIGGIQCQHKTTGKIYVRWPQAIVNNKIVLSSVSEAKGNVPAADQEPLDNVTPNELEFRDKFKPTFRATDGHMVRSKSEMLIDNELYRYELAHAYERKLPIEEDLYCDFYIPKGKVYIEYWGYEEDSKYLVRREQKIEIYRKYDFRLIQLTEKEVQSLDDNLPRLLLGFEIRTEQFR
jgi:hypothetical protein